MVNYHNPYDLQAYTRATIKSSTVSFDFVKPQW